MMRFASYVMMFGLIALVSTKSGPSDFFDAFEDKPSMGLCFGMTRSLNLSSISPALEDISREEAMLQGIEVGDIREHPQIIRQAFRKVIGATLGICYDLLRKEGTEGEKNKLIGEIQSGKFSSLYTSKYMRLDRALENVREGVEHAEHEAIQRMLVGMEELSDKMQTDPSASPKSHLQKLQMENNRLSVDLQRRIKELENGRVLQITLGIVALGVIVILGLACYYCFIRNKGFNNSKLGETTEYDDDFLNKFKEYEKKSEQLKSLHEKIRKEQDRLKIAPKPSEKNSQPDNESEEESEARERGTNEDGSSTFQKESRIDKGADSKKSK